MHVLHTLKAHCRVEAPDHRAVNFLTIIDPTLEAVHGSELSGPQAISLTFMDSTAAGLIGAFIHQPFVCAEKLTIGKIGGDIQGISISDCPQCHSAPPSFTLSPGCCHKQVIPSVSAAKIHDRVIKGDKDSSMMCLSQQDRLLFRHPAPPNLGKPKSKPVPLLRSG